MSLLLHSTLINRPDDKNKKKDVPINEVEKNKALLEAEKRKGLHLKKILRKFPVKLTS